MQSGMFGSDTEGTVCHLSDACWHELKCFFLSVDVQHFAVLSNTGKNPIVLFFEILFFLKNQNTKMITI